MRAGCLNRHDDHFDTRTIFQFLADLPDAVLPIGINQLRIIADIAERRRKSGFLFLLRRR